MKQLHLVAIAYILVSGNLQECINNFQMLSAPHLNSDHNRIKTTITREKKQKVYSTNFDNEILKNPAVTDIIEEEI